MYEIHLSLLDIPLIRDALKDKLEEQQSRTEQFQLPTEMQRLVRLISDFEALESEWDYKLTAIVEQCQACKGPLNDCRKGTCKECGDSGCPVLENEGEEN